MSDDFIPYRERLNSKEDFKVKYTFYPLNEIGRQALPFQGYLCDFWYEDENHTVDGVFMIWPEFEDKNGEVISSGFVLEEGTARMWIVSEKFRDYHQKRIKVGTIGYFMEGSRRMAKCEVTEIVDLMSNPVR